MATAAVFVSATVLAAEASLELQKQLAETENNVAVPVIIMYRSELNPFALRAKLKTEERRFRRSAVPRTLKAQAFDGGERIVQFIDAIGGSDTRNLWITSSVAANLTADMIDQVLAQPDVIQVRPDAVVDSPLPMAGVVAAPEWNIAAVGAPALWQLGYLGGSVVVATLDTGVDALHPELATAYRGGSNSWFDPYGEHATPYDRTGHGTQVMGLIVGDDASGLAIGVAPQAKWIAAKIFDDAGVATESAIHAAFQWLLDPDGDPMTDDAPDVVNHSWSIADVGICNTAFQPDIEALRAADIAMVFSAGNFGPQAQTGVSPGNNPGVVSIGAVDSNNSVVGFSSRGPSTCDDSLLPKLVAPGDNVQTTDLSFGGNPYYISVSGTSFAAPHVAGVLALLRDAVPPASVDELESALLGTAIDLDPVGPDQDSGYGLVDAGAALDALSYSIDMDGDGYGPTRDCDDTDPNVYPGAPEIGRDGIDQDCNGYDLTIKVHQAVYSHDGTSLRLRVTSGLREFAEISVVGVGPLVYREAYKDWFMNGGQVDGYANPVITVRGIEGDLAVRPRKPLPKRQ
jgi:bacillopeptidase F